MRIKKTKTLVPGTHSYTHKKGQTYAIKTTKRVPVNLMFSITSQHLATITKYYIGVLGLEKFKAMMEKMKF